MSESETRSEPQIEGVDLDREEKEADCYFCHQEMVETSAQNSGRRKEHHYTCNNCRRGKSALVEIHAGGDEPEKARKRAERSNSVLQPLSVGRIAAAIRSLNNPGSYRIERIGPDSVVVRSRENNNLGVSKAEILSATNNSQIVVREGNGSLVIREQHGDTAIPDDDADHDPNNGPVQTDGGTTGVSRSSGKSTNTTDVGQEMQGRSRRAITDHNSVSLLKTPGIYAVTNSEGKTYQVNLLQEDCSGPDHAERCKHYRRVKALVDAGLVPRPDGKLPSQNRFGERLGEAAIVQLRKTIDTLSDLVKTLEEKDNNISQGEYEGIKLARNNLEGLIQEVDDEGSIPVLLGIPSDTKQ